jgi:hypothetical protein
MTPNELGEYFIKEHNDASPVFMGYDRECGPVWEDDVDRQKGLTKRWTTLATRKSST